ncbi:MAG: T9SS type A sorting domain-containing protein [Bacteroidales bacterium]|nr:T9SS type A sorting domain-containing protein [Bacteroidales bacterium]
MVKKLLVLIASVAMGWSLAAQHPVDATIDTSDILYWVGTGSNRAVLIVNWADPDTALAWGFRFNGTVSAQTMVDSIEAADPRFWTVGSPSYNGDIHFLLSNGDTLGLVDGSTLPLGFNFWWTNINGVSAGSGAATSLHNGDVFKYGDQSNGVGWDPMGTYFMEYAWLKTPTPVPVPGSDTETPTDATIDTADILYWVGTGSNKLTFVVNWADTALAWGYRFNTESVTMPTVINDLAAADPRLTFGTTGMLDDIWFVENNDTLKLTPGNYWEHSLNGLMSAGMGTTMHDGDFSRWADPAGGVAVDSFYYDGWGWFYTYAYPATIYPVSIPSNDPPVEDATIDTADLVYWVGTGSNALTFVVNWADTALAWGYRFNSDSVRLSTVMNHIAAVDPRFSYTGTSMVSDINFIANGDTLGITPGNWWSHYLNGTTSAGMNQWMHNGDFSRWADPAAGVVVDSVYHEEWNGWMEYIYVYPQTITPVNKAVSPVDALRPEDIRFWVGEGDKEIILAVSWPDTSLAWGYRYSTDRDITYDHELTVRNGDTLISINYIIEEIDRVDSRFFSRWPNGRGGGVNPPERPYVIAHKIPAGPPPFGINPPYHPRFDRKDGGNVAQYGLFFVENGDTLSGSAMNGSSWEVKVNGYDANFEPYVPINEKNQLDLGWAVYYAYAREGSIIHCFDTSTIGRVMHDSIGQEVYYFPQEVTPVAPTNAAITSNEIEYWIGEGENKVIFVVNWADTALAWGYRFASDSVTLATMMDDIAAADSRFSYSGEGMVNDINFIEYGDTLGITPGNWWEHSINGISSMGMGQWFHNGDMSRWADPAAGIVVDSFYYDGWGWLYTYVYPRMIHPVSDPNAEGPFCGIVGTEGCTAIALDDSRIKAWATGCTVVRGSSNLSDPDAADVSYGEESAGVGPASTSTLDAVSLGDGGMATLTFDTPIANGSGFDFAVFENSFDDYFLELAFVEVSSDGEHFVRFPATSLTQTRAQIGGLGRVDATYINNLAGKYRVGYGTPFDLEELRDSANLDINSITHVRIIDVVGSIDPQYGTYDAFGHIINDPFPTISHSAGFDLEGVCVLNQHGVGINDVEATTLNLYPNPARNVVSLTLKAEAAGTVAVYDMTGRQVLTLPVQAGTSTVRINTADMPNGVYMVSFGNHVEKLVVRH